MEECVCDSAGSCVPVIGPQWSQLNLEQTIFLPLPTTPAVKMEAERDCFASKIQSFKDLLNLIYQSLSEIETYGHRAVDLRPACPKLNHTHLQH